MLQKGKDASPTVPLGETGGMAAALLRNLMSEQSGDAKLDYQLGALHGAMATMCFLVARFVQDKPLDVAIAEAKAVEGGEGLDCVFRMIEPMMSSVIARAKSEPSSSE